VSEREREESERGEREREREFQIKDCNRPGSVVQISDYAANKVRR
jgi:hypothetical protein